MREHTPQREQEVATNSIFERIERATLKPTSVELTADLSQNARITDIKTFTIPWAHPKPDVTRVELIEEGKLDQKLVQSVVRAHTWLRQLSNGSHTSVESLAAAVKLNPKVIRQALRLAYLSPTITNSILQGNQPAQLSLASIPFTLPLSWERQDEALEGAR
jgi:hypothetical protein